jgi:uracil-DNA glycosylase
MTENPAPKKKTNKPKMIFQLPDRTPVAYKHLKKFDKDMIRYQNGGIIEGKVEIVTVPDAYNPLGDRELIPDPKSPICAACGLDQTGCRSPYMAYAGSENPVATIIVESISRKEDDKGVIGAGGLNGWIAALIYKLQEDHGVALEDIRWVPLTRCASRADKLPNYKTKGNWCRHYVIRDLMLHPPKVVIPVGTAVLGLLSHKSNAGDWSGRLLTWRGWPDDWLTEPDYMLDRPDPLDPTKTVQGHPLYGQAPNIRIPMVPLQNPRLVLASQNEIIMRRWQEDLVYALKVGKEIQTPLSYDRPWYRISTDPEEIIRVLEHVYRLALEYENFIVAYDTETTGLKPWAYFRRVKASGNAQNLLVRNKGAAIKEDEASEDEIVRSPDPRIVFMMFRWVNPETGKPESIGFPWDYPESEIKPYLADIAPHVISVLASAEISGHNLTFDELFTIATVGRRERENEPFNPDGSWNENWLLLQDRINLLAQQAKWDTWHMAFTALQRRGSLGLEILTYDWVPELAGYEEDMTLMISLYGDQMNPANNKGGHYANCPKKYWDTHLKPYVMGDVEAAYISRDKLAERLRKTKVYKIPLAKPDRPGFRYYQTPSRDWVYQKIVSPASRTLTKMMARGMYINPDELMAQEKSYPEKVQAAKMKLRQADPAIEHWCLVKRQESETRIAQNPDSKEEPWELDLENKSQLKELLFDILECKIVRLTKNGRKLYGEDPADWDNLDYNELKEFAAVDKYTLNRLAVDHPNLRPLQEYRKVFKLYSTYVRPMRNMMAAKLDKKQRVKEPHLSVDHCVHAQFMLTGTRSGRLSSRDPNLQQLPNEGLVKRLFGSRFRDRGCIYAADLSQIELRLMAAACGDPSMVQAYLDDIDIHSLTASKIFHVPYETFTKKHMEDLQKKGKSDEAKKLELQRKIAKTTNFLTGYGGGAFGLQNVLANNEVYMTIEECEAIVTGFFEAYPALKRFLGVYKNFIEENGVAVSLFGRVRQFEEVFGEDREAAAKALRAGCNHLIQSTASDTMLICLTAIEDLMREANLNSLLVSTVHDSLVIDAVREELPEVHAIVNGVLNNIPDVIRARMPDYDTSWMVVPLAGDSEVGLNYLETNKVSGDNPDWDRLLQPKQK